MNWLALILAIALSFLMLSAAFAAMKEHPKHPFVEAHSRIGANFFYLSAFSYGVMAVLYFFTMGNQAYIAGLCGLLAAGLGWVKTRAPR